MSLHQLRASRQNPCRVCGRPNQRCLNYADGGTLCMNVGDFGAKAVDCGPLGTGYYHAPPRGNVVPLSRPIVKPKPEPCPMASLEARDRAYKALIELAGLSDEHRAHLAGPSRGLPDEMMNRFASLPHDADKRRRLAHDIAMRTGLDSIPGFYKDHGGAWTIAGTSGLLIPVCTPSRLIQAMQIRADDSRLGKYVWFSSSRFGGPTLRPPFHYTFNGPRLDVWVCEGALKATIAAHLSGEAFIGLPGCHIGDLAAMVEPLEIEPRFILAPDADWRTNPQVAKAWQTNLDKMQEAGLDVRVATWEPEQGKGIDDVLLNHSQPFIASMTSFSLVKQ